MKVFYDNKTIECTPGKYIELLQKGAFGDSKPATSGLDQLSPKDRDRDYFHPMSTFPPTVAVYGCVQAYDWPPVDVRYAPGTSSTGTTAENIPTITAHKVTDLSDADGKEDDKA
jgi:hypothetical protein